MMKQYYGAETDQDRACWGKGDVELEGPIGVRGMWSLRCCWGKGDVELGVLLG